MERVSFLIVLLLKNFLNKEKVMSYWFENSLEDSNSTYYDSAEGTIISKKRAIKEIKDHGLDPEDFFNEKGEKDKYNTQEVLRWLGY